MRHRVAHDVSHVLVRELVNDLAPASLRPHELSPAKDPEVLAYEWLGHIERVDELMYAVGVVREEFDHREPHRGGQCPQEIAGGLIGLEGWVRDREALLTVDFS